MRSDKTFAFVTGDWTGTNLGTRGLLPFVRQKVPKIGPNVDKPQPPASRSKRATVHGFGCKPRPFLSLFVRRSEMPFQRSGVESRTKNNWAHVRYRTQDHCVRTADTGNFAMSHASDRRANGLHQSCRSRQFSPSISASSVTWAIPASRKRSLSACLTTPRSATSFITTWAVSAFSVVLMAQIWM